MPSHISPPASCVARNCTVHASTAELPSTTCQALGINLHATNTSAPDTAVAVVRDYAMRTFSRADAVEPREPFHIRAACCNRRAGPALDFAELPDARMHWTPLPRRGTEGIEAWLPQWMCMRCQNELRLERICVPDPTPSCPVCLTPMLWEVDCARRQERWVCSRCPFARSSRPLALRPVPPCRSPALPIHAPPALPAADPGVHNALHAPVPAPTQFTTLDPPPLPLRDCTNSALYVPLLLDAAGMLSAEAQRDWRSRAPINEWWDAAVQALRARAFVPVHELSAAVEHVAQAFAPPVLHSPSVMRLRAWAAAQAGNVTSLAELVHVIATSSRHRCRRRCSPLWSAPRLSPPLRVSSRACEPGRSRYPHNRPLLTLPRPRLCAGKVMSRLMTLLRPRLCVDQQGDAPLLPPAAPAPAAPPQAQHTAASHGTHPPGAHGEPVADFIGSAAARIVDIERRARGRGRRGGRGRGRGRHASPAARDTDAVGADQCQPGPPDSTASQRRVISAEAAFRAGLQSLDAIDLAATLRGASPQHLAHCLPCRAPAHRGRMLRRLGIARLETLLPRHPHAVAPCPGETRVRATELDRRCELFRRGDWPCLLAAAEAALRPSELVAARAARTADEARAARATALVHLGELSPPREPLSPSLLRLALPTPSASFATRLIARRSPVGAPRSGAARL